MWGKSNDLNIKLDESSEQIVGTLKIQVFSASFQRDTEIIGQMDPYVVIECRKIKYKSKVIRNGGRQPEWKETF